MSQKPPSIWTEDLFTWIPLNFFLFFTPRFIRSRIARRLLGQLGIMIRNQVPFVEGLPTIASPRRVRLPVHYTITLVIQWLIFALIEWRVITWLLPVAWDQASPLGGLGIITAVALFLLLLFLLSPGFVLWLYLGLLALGIILMSLLSVIGALIFFLFILFFLQMNIHSVKINDSYLVRRIARALARKLANGTSLALAMESLPRLFTPFHTTMMKTAETTGKMEEVLDQLAEYEQMRGRFYVIGLKNLAYPSMLFLIAVLLISFITIKIHPKFQDIFSQLGASLPALTTSVVKFLSSIAGRGGVGLLFLMVMVIVIFSAWGSLKYYVPVIRHVARPLSASRFLMALGYQLKARLPINEAVRMARHVDAGLIFSRYMHDMQERVEKGVPLGTALERVAIFPPLAAHWVSMAEFAEALDTELIAIAKKLAEDGEASFTRLTTILEPLVHLVIAFIIGLVVISFYLPIFNIPVVVMGAGG